MKTILIVEDHKMTREMLAEIVQQAISPDVEISEAATYHQAKDLIDSQSFNLAIVDISLPDGNGIELATLLKESSPNTYVVIATIFDDDDHIFEALCSGVSGYLLKEQPREELKGQLAGIINGRPPISPAVARKMLRFFHKIGEKNNHQDSSNEKADTDNVTKPSEVEGNLTMREKEVLALIGEGQSRTEIADNLGISLHTVGDHIKKIYQKLNIHSQSHAAAIAIQMKLHPKGVVV